MRRVFTALLLLTASTTTVEAQVELDPSWRRANAVDWVATGIGFGAAAIVSLAVETYRPRWQGEGPVDAFFLRMGTDDLERRRRVGLASDILGLLTLSTSIAIDPALGYVADRDLGQELSLVNLRSLSMTALIVAATKYGFRRRRPGCPRFEEQLAQDQVGEREGHCHRAGDNRSFISGHAAFVWTSAALLCTAHRHLELYRSRAADVTGCAIAAGLATTTSILRMVAKRHHFSDVLVGALVGVLSGWILPALATFGFGGER